jgi:hypothetical protein
MQRCFVCRAVKGAAAPRGSGGRDRAAGPVLTIQIVAKEPSATRRVLAAEGLVSWTSEPPTNGITRSTSDEASSVSTLGHPCKDAVIRRATRGQCAA